MESPLSFASFSEAAFHLSRQPVAIIDWEQQTIHSFNPAFSEALGLPAPSLAGQRLEEVLGVPIHWEHLALNETDDPRPTHTFELTYRRASGQEIAYVLESSLFLQGDRPYGFLHLRDLTEQILAEASRLEDRDRTLAQDDVLVEMASDESFHRGDLGKALQTLTGRAGKALALSTQQNRLIESQLRHMMKMESVGRLAGGVAHDFNNIIQAINGYTLLLLEHEKLSENAQGYLMEMKAATEMAIRLTRKLLAMSRKQPMTLLPISLNKISRDVQGILGKLIPRESELILNLDPELPETMLDAGLIEQVIINLVVNARDALPPTGGRIIISTRRQTITPTEARSSPEAHPGNYVVLSVADNGFGMDENTLNRLFEPFFTTKEEGKGTGLGLSIVYGIIKQHQGWIEVQSKLGKGTTFVAFFPVI